MNNIIQFSDMKKLMRNLSVTFCSLLILSAVTIDIPAQENDPDYPESLGRCLGVNKIKSKKIPKEFGDFEYFYFDKFPNQDTNNPKRDLKQRVFIRGEVKLKSGKILKMKEAFVKSISINGDPDNYRDIYFETKTVDGLKYIFKGEFLESWIEEKDGSFTTRKGTLTKFKDGKMIAQSELKFYEYAEL